MSYVDPMGLNSAWVIPGKRFDDYSMLEKIAFVHANRNVFNEAPCTLFRAKALNYTQLLPPLDVLHRKDVNYPGDSDKNQKWLSPDGKSEAIYDGFGNLVTNQINGGTFNFVAPADNPWDPRNAKATTGHFLYDVLPYYFFGEKSGPIFPLGEPNCGCDSPI